MKREEFIKLLGLIHFNKYITNIILIKDFKDLGDKYENLVLTQYVRHLKINFNYKQGCLAPEVNINIDVIIIDDESTTLPIVNFDCNVNALMYNDEKKIHINPIVPEQFRHNIFENIRLKQTDITVSISDHRLQKMKNKRTQIH